MIWTPTTPALLPHFTRAWCLVICVMTLIHGPQMLSFLRRRPADYRPPTFLGLLRVPVLGTTAAASVGALFCAAMGAAAWAPDPRPFLLAALVTYFLFFSQVFYLAYIGRKTNTLPFILIALLLGHTQVEGEPLVDALLVVQAVVALLYWITGIQKLRQSGLRWSDGLTLRTHLIEHALWDDRPRALRLAASPGLCRAASAFTLVLELAFPVAIFVPASVPVILGVGVLFHLGIELTMGISYWKYLCPGYLAFLLPWLAWITAG